MSSLTEPQRRALEHAAEISRVGYPDGAMIASATARVLTRLGLVVYLGEYECDSDHCDRAGDHPHVGSAYAITDEGKRLVEIASLTAERNRLRRIVDTLSRLARDALACGTPSAYLDRVISDLREQAGLPRNT